MALLNVIDVVTFIDSNNCISLQRVNLVSAKLLITVWDWKDL